jgi:ABC-type nitrate/sulfonate/bicarbonate transport system permease component
VSVIGAPLLRLRSLRGLLPLAALLGLWQLIGNPHSPTTPAPSSWWPAFESIEKSGALWPAVKITMLNYVEGFAIAIILGIAFGVALGASRLLSLSLNPILEFLRFTPAAAIVPALILLLHAGHVTELVIIVYGTIWPILLNTASARRKLAPLRLDIGRTLRLSRWEQMRKVVLPSLIPEIVVGVRIAASVCLIVTLLVDFLVATGGIGYLLVQYGNTFAATSAFAMIAVVGILGILINVVLGGAERAVLGRWPAGAR